MGCWSPRLSCLITQKKSKSFSIIVTVSDFLSIFLDHWFLANSSCTKLMPLLSNAHGPKSAYTLEVNASIPLLTWCFFQDTCMGHRWVSDPNNLPCCNDNSVTHWPHQRIICQINWRWFIITKLISMIKNDVHFPSSKICSVYYNSKTNACFTNRRHWKYDFALQFVCNRILTIYYNLTTFCLHFNSK